VEREAVRAEKINPSELYDSVGYGFSHAARQRSGSLLHLAGQVAWDKNGKIVGPGDLATQTRQVLNNIRTVLTAAGATPSDILRLRTYVVDHSPDKLGPVLGEIAQFYGKTVPAPNTFIGVSALALPDFLIEIEATALVD
jgi:enamine deaminase RidA (YjgF/YER057c/UK114 family)